MHLFTATDCSCILVFMFIVFVNWVPFVYELRNVVTWVCHVMWKFCASTKVDGTSNNLDSFFHPISYWDPRGFWGSGEKGCLFSESWGAQGSTGNSWRHLLLQNVVIHGIRRCNVVFTLERRYKYMKNICNTVQLLVGVLQCRKLEEAKDFKCVFTVYCVLESK